MLVLCRLWNTISVQRRIGLWVALKPLFPHTLGMR